MQHFLSEHQDGQKLSQVIPAMAHIIYNPNYVADYSNKFEQGKGGMYYLKMKLPSSEGYSNVSPVGRARSNKAVTFTEVEKVAENLDSHRAKWVAKLKAKDPEVRMGATILEVVYQTAIRIGSRIGAAKSPDGKEQETYGLTVLKVKNVKAFAKRVKLHYIGKAAQEQTQYLVKGVDPHYDKAIDNVISYLQGKKPTDFVFVANGKRFTPPS
jgi:hypothetical protein